MKDRPFFPFFLIRSDRYPGFYDHFTAAAFYAEQLGATPLWSAGYCLPTASANSSPSHPRTDLRPDRPQTCPAIEPSRNIHGFLILAFSTNLSPSLFRALLTDSRREHFRAQAYISDVTEPEKRAKSSA